MTATLDHAITIPVFSDKYFKGWPEHVNAPMAQYVPIGVAMSTAHATDAHFAAYSAPEVPRRLAKPEVFDALFYGVEMVLFVVDIDCPEEIDTDGWWIAERSKINCMLARHRGGYVFRTRGGYRIVYRLTAPIVLLTVRDAEDWKLRYVAWTEYLAMSYAIVGDESCKDWTRLYRLPCVIRDGRREDRERIGDPYALGTWDVLVGTSRQTTTDARTSSESVGTLTRGQRHPSMLSLAGAMRRRGADEPTILAALTAFNAAHCSPPKPAAELTEIARFVGAKPIGAINGHRIAQLDHTAELTTIDQPDDIPPPTDDDAPPPREDVLAGYHVGDSTPPAPATAYTPRSERVVDVGRKDIPPIRSYSTGLLQLDNLLGGGINTRELAIVLGPPGSGKTAFAVSLAVHLQRHVPVLYPSTELEQHELMARVTANVLRKPWGGIRRGTLGRERITEAIDGLNIWLLGCDVLPMAGDAAITLIEREAKWIADEQRQPPVIFVDYLQDLARGAERDMRSRVGDHARALRAMSQRLDCALVAISSVARTFYSARKAQEFREADDPTVYLAAAKESGDVDYAAARVLFLDAEDDRDKEERAVRIAVAKSRDARTGFAGARVISECGVFLPAPDVLDQMAQGGRAVEATTVVSDEADQAMFKRLVREHADGKRELCTKRYLRTGNSLGKKPVGKERAEAALDRLVQAGRASLVTIERIEGGKPKAREIYEPIGAAP